MGSISLERLLKRIAFSWPPLKVRNASAAAFEEP